MKTKNTIPKTIHYCWFGKNDKPDNVKKCIESWKKYMTEYELTEWNEDNFSIKDAPLYVRQAYEARKFAFVSDYVRMYALYNFGGIYFDTDVEVLKNFEDKLDGYEMVLSFEHAKGLSCGIIASAPKMPAIGEFLKTYDFRRFYKEDGTFDLTPINCWFNRTMTKYGVDLSYEHEQSVNSEIKVYTSEVLSAFDMTNWCVHITEKTCSVHHMAGTWLSPKIRIKKRIKHIIMKFFG